MTCVVQVAGKVRDRLEVAPGIAEDELRELALASPRCSRALAGREVRTVIVRPPEARQHRPGMSGAPDHAGLDPAAPAGRVAVVTDSTAYLPPGSGRGRQRHGGAGAGRHRCDVVRRGRGHLAAPRSHRRCGRGRPSRPRGPRREAFAEAYAEAAAAGRERHRLGAPVRRHVRDVRRGARSPPREAGAAGRRWWTRGASRWGSASRCSPRLPRPPTAPTLEEVAAAARGRAAASVDAVLRRHPRVPAPRRPDRRGAGVARVGARGQADPRGSSTAGSRRWRRCVRRRARWRG